MAGPSNCLIPHLSINGASEAIEFYKTAFGAEEVTRHAEPNGTRLMHAELRIGGSTLFLADEFPEHCGGKSRTPRSLGGTPFVIHQNVSSCDAAIDRAVKAGAKVIMPAQDQFWGDRYGQIEDKWGYQWSFSNPLNR